MLRRGAIAVVVLLQLAAGAGRGLMVCRHADGTQRIEPVLELCCRPDASGVSVCEDDADAGHDQPGPVARDGDHCTDFPLEVVMFAAARDARMQAPAPPALPAGLHVDAWIAPRPSACASRASGPASRASPLSLRTPILRC